MRYELVKADAQNKSYITFTSDSIMRQVADYYDSHGSSNEQMRAYYLLGSVYRDLGEAPRTIQCYQDAIDRADTLSSDCDYRTLSRIHGQLGDLFAKQALFENAILQDTKAYKTALKSHDTLTAIIMYGHIANSYNSIGNTDSALIINSKTREMLVKHGYIEEANTFLALPIYLSLTRHDYKTARTYIHEYEHNSSFSTGKEYDNTNFLLLNYYKGLYKLGTNSADSAIIYFQRLLSTSNEPNHIILSHTGLLTAYSKKRNTDSIAYYADITISDLQRKISEIEQNRLQDIQALYNFTKFQHKAENETKRANAFRLWLIVISFSFIIVALTVYYFLSHLKSKQKESILILTNKYVFEMQEYQRLKSEMQDMKTKMTLSAKDYDIIRNQFETISQKYERAKKVLADMHEDGKLPDDWNIEDALLNSNIVRKFHKMAACATIISDDDWNELRKTVNIYMPNFIRTLSLSANKLNNRNTNLCILIRLRFIPSEICSILEIKKNNLSNIRKRLLMDIFNTEGSASYFDERIRSIAR